MTDTLVVTIQEVDLDVWKKARKYGIEREKKMGEVVTEALREYLKHAGKKAGEKKGKAL